MTSKKRILFINEFSELATGFSNYGKKLIRQLYETDKYEIAELGTYIKQSDPRIKNVPWKVYASVPEDNDRLGQEEYNKKYEQWGKYQHLGQFGASVIDKVLLDFKPHYVCSIMDPWMSTVVADTPLRKFFRWIYMPCIDSTPQRQEWLNMYESADYLLGYSDFAINVLKEQSPKIRSAGAKKLLPMPARPGADINIFKPMNKDEIRSKWGLSKDIPIILSCMRNQQRKLFCELIDSFAKFKIDNPNSQIAQKSVLLLHSSGYDAGQEYWTHIARLSQNKYLPYFYEGLHRHILHTYQCDSCHKRLIGYAIWLLNVKVTNGRAYMRCPACGTHALRTPNTNIGYTREELAEIFNLANIYVQVSIAGADEMPITEAKACGIPVLSSANAAMKEKVMIPTDFEGNLMTKKADGTPYTMHKGGIPIKISYEFHEASTMQRRCYFDREDLAKKFLILENKEEMKKLSEEAVESILDNCTYESVSDKWQYVIDNLPAKKDSETWEKEINPNCLPNININNITIPNIPDQEFVDWCYKEILKSEVDQVGRNTWIDSLKNGMTRKSIVEYFVGVAIKDKKSDIILYQYRVQQKNKEFLSKVLEDKNILQGIVT